MADGCKHDDEDIAANLSAVIAGMASAARDAGRDPAAVTLVAVSKFFGPGRVRPALVAGHRVFGENRVQEADDKWPSLKAEFADVRLHLIGPLQRNKVRRAVALFDVIETVDRPKLARALALEMDRSGKRPDCLIQVNIGEETQKAGILPTESDAFISLCRDQLKLRVKGLMCIPPFGEDPSPYFARLAEIARRNGLDELSMGMSADFEIAIGFGATLVRVGSAIFGKRPATP